MLTSGPMFREAKTDSSAGLKKGLFYREIGGLVARDTCAVCERGDP